MCCLFLGVLGAVDVIGGAGVIGPPADRLGLKDNDVNGIKDTTVFGLVVDELICRDLIVKVHGALRASDLRVLKSCEDEGS